LIIDILGVVNGGQKSLPPLAVPINGNILIEFESSGTSSLFTMFLNRPNHSE
jgi:hypothetical protein